MRQIFLELITWGSYYRSCPSWLDLLILVCEASSTALCGELLIFLSVEAIETALAMTNNVVGARKYLNTVWNR